MKIRGRSSATGHLFKTFILGPLFLIGCKEASNPSATMSVRSDALVPAELLGVNLSNLYDSAFVDPTIERIRQLGATWVRIEIDPRYDAQGNPQRSPEYWAAIVDRFRAPDVNVNVLAALTNVTWNGGALDGDLQNVGVRPAQGPCCDPNQPGCVPAEPRQACALDLSTDPGCSPTPNWGLTTLAPGFIQAATPYLQALSARGVNAWEIWNEANNDVTALCPANYAQLLAQIRSSWPGIGIVGPSLLSIGSDTWARNYVDSMVSSDPIRALGYLPWDRVMLHPYPDENGIQDPAVFLVDQSESFASLGTPLWFTEIGWQSQDLISNARFLAHAFATVSQQELSERVFWFQLYNCAGNYGLLNRCGESPPPACRRPTFEAFQAERGPLLLPRSSANWTYSISGGPPQVGSMPFAGNVGSACYPGVPPCGTLWPSPYTSVSATRQFEVSTPVGNASLWIAVDDDAEVIINGTLVAARTGNPGSCGTPRQLTIPDGVLVVGTNTVTVNAFDYLCCGRSVDIEISR